LEHINSDQRESVQCNDESYLADHFERRGDPFKIIDGNTDDLKGIFFQLRHEVYCEDHPEFNEIARITGMEMDDYDDHSLFLLLMYKPLAMMVGGVRLVLPQVSKQGFGLPCCAFPESPFLQEESLPFQLEKMAEISRFLLAKRRMVIAIKEENTNHAIPGIHLFNAAYRSCAEKRLDGMVALMSPVLIRAAQIQGVPFVPFSSPVEYHGKRQAAYILFDEWRSYLKDNDDKRKQYHFFKLINDAKNENSSLLSDFQKSI